LIFLGRRLDVSIGERESPYRLGWAGAVADPPVYHAWL
jgi:hypothetical protein